MEMTQKDRDLQKDITLLLMYLSSWEENPFAPNGLHSKVKKRLSPEQLAYTYRRCWKGYDFDVLNELTEEGLADASGKNKSATITREGEERAIMLLKKLKAAME